VSPRQLRDIGAGARRHKDHVVGRGEGDPLAASVEARSPTSTTIRRRMVVDSLRRDPDPTMILIPPV
jgi:hypothetical protein